MTLNNAWLITEVEQHVRNLEFYLTRLKSCVPPFASDAYDVAVGEGTSELRRWQEHLATLRKRASALPGDEC